MSIFQKFKSNGKLLLTGEYTVLDGALSLAIPTRLGQSLLVKEADKLHHKIVWKAHKNDGKLWFKTILDIHSNKIEETDNINFSKRLLHIFQEANSKIILDMNVRHNLISLKIGDLEPVLH